MKFGPDVLLQIVSIVQEAILEGTDASRLLREIDVEVDPSTQKLRLTENYYSSTGRVPSVSKTASV